MLKSLVFWSCLVLASFAALADGGALPAELGVNDARAVRTVVQAQLKALADEEAAQAFAYATPAIRSRFHDAAAFAQMVRQSYPMLIRPASVSFFRPEGSDGGGAIQAVHFRDREGRLWRAIYELQRQPDKRWKINGCVVMPDDDSSTT